MLQRSSFRKILRKLLTSQNEILFFSSVPSSSPLPLPNPLQLSLLKQCNSLASAKLIHQQLIVQGLARQHVDDVVSMYFSCNASSQVIIPLLEHLSPSSSSSLSYWNALIRKSVKFLLFPEVIELYCNMNRVDCSPDCYTFPFVLKACGELSSLRLGKSVHCQAYLTGFVTNLFVGNSLITMYGRCNSLNLARQVFDEMCERGMYDVVSWNSIVAAYVQHGCLGLALELFGRMTNDFGVCPNTISLVNVLSGCAYMGCLSWGRQVHSFALRNELFENVFMGNALVDMYAKCGLIEEASKMFKCMRIKDVVSWNAMITGYAQAGRFDDALSLFEEMTGENVELNIVTWSTVIAAYAQRGYGFEALDLFRQMRNSGLHPNVATLVSLLSGCASVGALFQGKETHCYAIKCILKLDSVEPGDDLMLLNRLIDLYTKCKESAIARKIFDSVALKDRNVVTWTAMIGGYAQLGDADEALQLFSYMMQQSYTFPNAFTISCVLMACSQLGALSIGKQVHAYILRDHLEPSALFVANCLIDMYSKSGDIDAARIVFDNMKERNAVTCTSLMTGYGMHGYGEEVVHIFEQMRNFGLAVDGVTFVIVLYACSHSGMVEHGKKYFNNMTKDFGVIPGVEHYACMVDLLGRAGHFEEARELIRCMPMEPTPMVWRSLLGACKIHANIELGEYAACKLSELNSQDDGSYTLLSNIYAGARRWKDVSNTRSLMRNSGLKKTPGCSWVQEKQGIVSFYAGDRSHPLSQKIYELLSDLIKRTKSMGYEPETSFTYHDVDDEEKGDVLLEHSEKLALAYAILTSTAGATIRITKNLRVCGDCHTVFSYISHLVDHEIILRDSSRFHHFKKGCCSCKGFW